jgi:flavin-dependent dehydrogenase
MTAAETSSYDAIVIGGGPAGSTAGLVMARAGLRVKLLERTQHPRFHIGESLLPRNMALLSELGLIEALATVPRVRKLGAEFVLGDGQEPGLFPFSMGLVPGADEAVNIERAPFDAMLLNEARKAGVEVAERTALKKVLHLEEGRAEIETDAGETLTARVLVDASGQSTVLGKHLGLRKTLPDLKKVAYFGHFENVKRRPGDEGGYIVIVMTDDGWFWSIPLNETKTSIGLVMSMDRSKSLGIPPDQILTWAIERCPAMRERTADAVFPTETHVLADFSYRCAPYAGPGYFLVGDAAAFVDPIFSTGVCMGMMTGTEVARGIVSILSGKETPERVRHRYRRFIDDSTGVFFRLIRMYYHHSFRELFLTGQGPLEIHRATMSILAGHVYPRPAWSLRWRFWLLSLFIRVNRFYAIAPRRPRFSLVNPLVNSSEFPSPAGSPR